MNVVVSVAMVFLAADLSPVGDPKTVGWGKEAAAVMERDGLRFTIQGPEKVLVNLAGVSALRNKHVVLKIERDGAFVSTNKLRLRNRKGGPKGYPAQGVVGFSVPGGEHHYRLVTPEHELVVRLAATKRIARRLRAAAESPTAAPAADSEATASVAAEATTLEPAVASESSPSETVPEAPTNGDTVSAEDQAAMEEIAAVSSDLAAATPSVELAGQRATDLVKAERVAVYDLQLQDVSSKIGTVVTDSLLSEIRKLQGLSVIGMDEIRDMLSHEANKQFLGCESDESCLAEIAGALGVDDLVTGKLTKAGDGHVMLIRRIDQNRAKVAGTFDQRLKAGEGQEFLLAVGPAVEELFPDHPLREGARRGVPDEVALRLDPPPLPPWAFYTVAGAAAVAAAGGGVFGLLANSYESQFNNMARSTGEIAGTDLVDLEGKANSRATGANAAFATAGGLAVSAAIMFLFTDWQGYGTELQR